MFEDFKEWSRRRFLSPPVAVKLNRHTLSVRA